MRLRYFIITTFVLILVSVFSLSVHNYLAAKDYVSNTEALLRQTAATITNADWANPERTDLQRVETILSEELGDTEINRFFILREKSGKILYKSSMVSVLNIESIPLFPEWVLILKEDLQIRVYNLSHARFPDRILQVGLITPADKGGQFSKITLAILFLSIGGLGALCSWLLASVMFYPIRKVGRFLSTATDALDKKGILPTVPKELFSNLGKKDELRILTEDLDSLLNKINTNHKTSRLWAAQMAHELKTPLSQLLLHLESTTPENDPGLKKSYLYIDSIKTTINSFLDWAELENSLFNTKNVERVNVNNTMALVLALFEPEKKKRLEIKNNEPLVVLANIHHIQQLIQNITSNALKYSDTTVEIEVTNKSISIKDFGPGIASDVMEKIGDPFNFGNSQMQKKGHGLGLAWVKTICSRYNWDLKINTSQEGTTIIITFPTVLDPSTEKS
ncbi:MAG: HAMP domain-containing histidine kinase [Bdellovibrionaceae bacterium]|nr:HAMP domain-containing histidine kinase [Pseudobdellovibrionaceae bacterium]